MNSIGIGSSSNTDISKAESSMKSNTETPFRLLELPEDLFKHILDYVFDDKVSFAALLATGKSIRLILHTAYVAQLDAYIRGVLDAADTLHAKIRELSIDGTELLISNQPHILHYVSNVDPNRIEILRKIVPWECVCTEEGWYHDYCKIEEIDKLWKEYCTREFEEHVVDAIADRDRRILNQLIDLPFNNTIYKILKKGYELIKGDVFIAPSPLSYSEGNIDCFNCELFDEIGVPYAQMWVVSRETSDQWAQYHPRLSTVEIDGSHKQFPHYLKFELFYNKREGDVVHMNWEGHQIKLICRQEPYRYGGYGRFEDMVLRRLRFAIKENEYYCECLPEDQREQKKQERGRVIQRMLHEIKPPKPPKPPTVQPPQSHQKCVIQ